MTSFLKYRFPWSENFLQVSTPIYNNTGEKLMESILKIWISRMQRNSEEEALLKKIPHGTFKQNRHPEIWAFTNASKRFLNVFKMEYKTVK